MRVFLERYGIAIFTLVIIGVMITLASPIGTIIGNSIKSTIETFISSDDELELEPGLYDENDNLMYDWDTLVNTYGIDVEKDYYDEETWESIEEYREGNYPGAIFMNNDDLKNGVKLVIDSDVQRIGNSAFEYNETLNTVIIPDSVTLINHYAFGNCISLKSITIPDSVKTIGIYAFECCYALTSVTMGNSVEIINEGVFEYCENLATITIPNSVKTIGDWAFYDCINLSIIVSNNVTTIGEDAFFNVHCVCYNGNLDTSEWYAKNYHIYEDEFEVLKEPTCSEAGIQANICSICGNKGNEKIILDDHTDSNNDNICDFCNKLLPGLYDENDNLKISWEDLTNIEYAKYSVNGKEQGILNVDKNGVLTACYDGEWNFSSNYLYGKLVISNSVTSIARQTFVNCYNLTEVIIPNSVTTIGSGAFAACTNIEKINIPASVTSIEGNVFSNISNVKSITVDTNNPVYDSRENCNAIIETATNTLIIGCMNTTIPNTVINIGEDPFYGNTNLRSIIIPDSVISIGGSAFTYCPDLKTIYIPSSVKIIEDVAFLQSRKTLNIYCEVSEKQSGWSEDWNFNAASITYGVSRSEYENLIAQTK